MTASTAEDEQAVGQELGLLDHRAAAVVPDDTDYLGFVNAHAADLAFESYFDEPGDYIRSASSVTPIRPVQGLVIP